MESASEWCCLIYLCSFCLSFHLHVTTCVLALARGKNKVASSFLISIFSSKRFTAPSALPLPHLNPFFLPVLLLFWQRRWPHQATVLQLKTYSCFTAQHHNIFRIIFKTSFFKQLGTRAFIRRSVLSRAFHPASRDAVHWSGYWVVTLGVNPLAL